MENSEFNKSHFILNSIATSHDFTTPQRKITPVLIPEQNRSSHSGRLRGDLATISSQLETLKQDVPNTPLQMGVGIQVEFESFPEVKLAAESLSNETKRIELHNVATIVKDNQTTTLATVYIPDGKLDYFEDKITDYVNIKTNKNDEPIDNRKLLDAIQSIHIATFKSIWSDNNDQLPDNKDERIWWEFWISTPQRRRNSTNQSEEIITDFTNIATRRNIFVSPHKLFFPEHTVIQVQSTQNQIENDNLLLSRVAEIRSPKITAEFFDSADSAEQEQWSQDLLNRLDRPNGGNEPYVCILDTGVNIEHPLLSPFSGINDQLTVTDTGDPTDNNGHGSGMAGLAMWGDLTDVLGTTERIFIGHKLESVKIIDQSGDNEGKPLGLITSDSVSEAENTNPDRKRIFSMSLSANSGTENGRPSSWSSAIDSLAVDYLGEGQNPRLFTICGGNTGNNLTDLTGYPTYNQLQDIHDPAQAWNVITVGAYTEKVTISDSTDYRPLARQGGLSPYSTTSLVWDRRNAPIKPEVVFEGGNVGIDQYGCAGMHDLQLLSTNNDFSSRHFKTTNATSAATALAARFTAQVKIEYPDLWPETIRGLTVRSAYWTNEMFKLISDSHTFENSNKTDMSRLTRMVGFGVPNITKAIKSANNSLSLVIQEELQPFQRGSNGCKTKDMHLHNLPWPKETLQALGDVDVELTITLSYFIEPNPSSRNILNKYSYASHQLRFDVKRPLELDSAFQKRVNAASREPDDDKPDRPDDSNWKIGIDNRHRGSIHKDIWTGSAVELAERGQIAIYPAGGWWKTRTSHARWDSKARYALIVSLTVPEVNVDIYTEVNAKIEAMVAARSVINVNT